MDSACLAPQDCRREGYRASARKVGKMLTNSKGTKGLGKAVIDAVGFLSYLFGSLILSAIAFGAIGGMFMSTKRLFRLKWVKNDEDDGRSKPGGQSRQDDAEGDAYPYQSGGQTEEGGLND